MRNVLQVKVTNRNKFDIEERYDGILYTMASNKPVSLPYDAACHIFGVDFAPSGTGHLDPDLREQAFSHIQRRWGWNRTSNIKESRANFDRIEFSLTHMVMVEQPAEVEELPAPHEIVAVGKINRPRKEA